MKKTAMYTLMNSLWSDEVACTFYYNGSPDRDLRGTCGTACKHYKDFEHAKAAGERYLKKMAKEFGCESLGGIFVDPFTSKKERV